MRNLVKIEEVWYFRMMANGKRTKLSLNTRDVEVAKTRRNGLESRAWAEKWDEIEGLKAKRSIATIGDVLKCYGQARELQLAARTYEDNAWALRYILKRVKGMEEVDGLPVTMLDGELVRAWQRLCLANAPLNDKLKADAAAVSCNSVLSQARSVFSKEAYARKIYNQLNVPDLLEFRTAPRLEELKRDSYVKPDDGIIKKMWQAAGLLKSGFDTAHGPPWKRPMLWLVWWLASQTGLRKGELGAMRARWFVTTPGETLVRTYFEMDFVPKGKRERDVPVVAGVEQEWRRVAAENGWGTEPGDYVFPNVEGKSRATLMEDLFKEFGAWMRENGWPRRQKAHELRKIFASDLTEVGDPYDTMRSLGHQDIKTTMKYAARRRVTAVDQGARYAANVIPLPQGEALTQLNGAEG